MAAILTCLSKGQRQHGGSLSESYTTTLPDENLTLLPFPIREIANIEASHGEVAENFSAPLVGQKPMFAGLHGVFVLLPY